MTAEIGNQTSYIAAIRKVVLPNPALEVFRAQFKTDAREILGYSSMQTVQIPASLTELLSPGFRATYEDVGRLTVDTFSLNSLRSVLFLRRAVAGNEVNRLLRTAHDRLTSDEFYSGRNRRTPTGRRKQVALPNKLPQLLKDIQHDEAYDNGRLPVVASTVERRPDPLGNGLLYGLVIDDGEPFSRVLIAQHRAVEDAAQQIQAVKSLRYDERFQADSDPLFITFARLPSGLNRETERFDEAVNLHGAVDFQLGAIEWRLNTPMPE